MICNDCGKLIGEGTMGTVLPLCQCQWRPKPQTFYIQDQSAEIAERLNSAAPAGRPLE